jgi:ligand-binding sensor domain-containing protein/DNA-binding CsgD family transcriptional regulator
MMRRQRPAWAAALLLLACAWLRLPAAAAEPNFANISIEDGLSQNTVTCILADRRGFIWFGTLGGLNRYDGYDFNVYNQCGRPDCLSHDRVNCMAQDEDGTFWIGTTGGGLDHFDPLGGTFSRYRSVAGDPDSLSDDSLRVILPAANGVVWIGTDNGLNRFDRRSGKFTRFLGTRGSSGLNAANAIYSLYMDRSGTLWAGSGDGLYRFNGGRGTLERFASDRADRNAQRHNQVNAIFEDDRGTLWLGTEGGLVRFDRESGAFRCRAETDAPLAHLYRSRIFAIVPGRQGLVWVATESGLYLFPRQDLLAIYFHAGAVPQRFLMNRFIISVFHDREDVVWAGTLGGIYKLDLRTRQFSMHGAEIENRERGSGTFSVLASCRDHRGDLWIGTYKHGLYRIGGALGETVTRVIFPGDPRADRNMAVSALLPGRDRVLWVGTSRGLYEVDVEKGAFRRHFTQGPAPGSLSHDQVTVLFEDRSGRLWAGTPDGLNLLDRQEGTFTVFRIVPHPAASGGRNSMAAIHQDRQGFLWVGTQGGGLNRFDAERGEFDRSYRHREGDPASLGSDIVHCLLEDSLGRFWVGTNNGGLNLLDRASGNFSVYDSEDGLANNDILGMLEDRQGNLWLSTNRGLCRFDPRKKIARNFTTRDGLQGDEFMPQSFYKAGDGEMFFGGTNGLTRFFPEHIKENPHMPPVVLTGVEIFNSGRKLAGDIGRVQPLLLGPQDRIVSFTFAALSYADPKRNRYAYKIEGLDDDWVQIGGRHEVTVSNLRPGKYVFRVRGSNNHGLWNEEGAALAMTMRAPWWQSWWFRVPAFLLLLGLFLFWKRTRTRRLAARIRTQAAMDKFCEKHEVSPREREILLLLLKGMSNKEIEDALFISMGTVKNHVYSIFQKIGVRNRAQLLTLFKNLQVK